MPNNFCFSKKMLSLTKKLHRSFNFFVRRWVEIFFRFLGRSAGDQELKNLLHYPKIVHPSFRLQAFDGVHYGSLDGLVAYGQGGNEHRQRPRCHKDPPLDRDSIGKIF